MAPSVLSALSGTDLQMAVTSGTSDGVQGLLASARISDQQAAASGIRARVLALACDVTSFHDLGFFHIVSSSCSFLRVPCVASVDIRS